MAPRASGDLSSDEATCRVPAGGRMAGGPDEHEPSERSANAARAEGEGGATRRGSRDEAPGIGIVGSPGCRPLLRERH